MSRYHGAGPFRQRSRVRWSDPDFSVRLASVEDLLQLQRDNVAKQLTTRWTTEEKLLQQVASDTQIVLCPVYRNGGPESEPESYKCWIWYVLGTEKHVRGVSLLDVGKDMFSGLAEASEPEELKRVILVMMEGVAEGSRFEPLL